MAAVAAWDEFKDNPLLDFTAPGMPSLMSNPYPMEFIQRDASIELLFEEFDAVRTIHMKDASDPSDIPASNLGYSVGHWEGELSLIHISEPTRPY